MIINKMTSTSIALILLTAITPTSILLASTMQYSNAQETSQSNTVVRDSETILLEGKTLPANDFIHLYDATPYMIMVGHVAVKLPCNANSETPYKILIGQAPDLVPADFELIKELSKPGQMCLYHVDLKSTMQGEHSIITDIALQNPTNTEAKFGPTATVVIGVDEIMPGAEEHEAMNMTNMTSTNSTG